jgi:hypothetical protein
MERHLIILSCEQKISHYTTSKIKKCFKNTLAEVHLRCLDSCVSF